ncbi:MAG: DUF1254 domain-containing protein [Pseudomonadota bacterium]
MSWRSLIRIRLVTIVAGLIFGSIIHIVAIFSLPYVSEGNAWIRIGEKLQANTLRSIPLASADAQILPFTAPDAYYAFCRFDLTSGPVALSLPEIEPFWTVSLYDRMSQNFYVIAGRDVKRATLDLILNRPRLENEDVDPAATSTRAKSDVITVRVPDREGLAVVRAPITGVANAVDTARRFDNIRCAPAS